MFTRTRTLSLVLSFVLLLAIVVPSAYASIIIPSNTTTAFIQTTGPTAGLGIGDYRTNAAGDNLPHEIVVNVACTPGQTYVFQVFDPAIDVAGNPPGLGVDGVTTRVGDEVRGIIVGDNTTFVLLSPGGATLANNTYVPGTSDADWTTLATVATTGTAGVDCGDYTVQVSTADNDDNAWRFRLVGGPALPPAETFDPAIGPDGVANTGDESSVGILSVSYQHVVGGCQDFFWFVQDGTPSIFMLAFDMDGAGSVTYQTPSGANITGTVSGGTVWNDTAPQQLARPALADMDAFDVGAGDLIGDATVNPEVGLWKATICIPGPANQYSFEVAGAPPVFLAPPELPDVVIVKDDGVVLVNSPGTTTYTLSITNNGPGAAMPIAGPEVVDTLPAGMTFNSCTVNAPLTGTCTESTPGSGIININLTGQAGPPAFLAYLPGPAAAPRDTGTVTLTVNIAAGLAGGSTLDNPATVDWTDIFSNDYPPNSDNDIDTVVVVASSATPTPPGGATSTPPGGATSTPPGGATSTPSGGGGCVGCGGGGGSPTATPGPILVDPAITKEASVDVARIGDTVTFTLTVTNPNAAPVTNVTVSDSLPAQLDFISVTTTFGSCAYDAGAHAVNCNLGMLAPHQVVTITIQTRVNDKARPPETLRNLMRIGDSQAEDSVIIIPDEIPVTGKGPGLQELLVIAALATLAASFPLALWLWRRRRNA
jgi:uncharacterized repeat protein (TIGR01451 family)